MTELDPNTDLNTRREQRRENRRRGAGSARQIDTTIKSPCISVCNMDDGFCVGCNRTIDEIRDWMIMTADEKRKVLAQIELRG